MSEIKTNKISPRKGTTQTIGDSGDTVSIACGATLSNAGTITTAGISGGTINNTTGTISGLIGQVEWDTTAKTTAFTAEGNRGYFIDTTSGEITVTFPASPTAGDVIALKDYANTFDTNKLILDPNGNKIQGSTGTFQVTVEGTSAQFIYVDATRGWVLTDASKASDIAALPTFTVATGGTITTCGDFKIHTFTAPGTFCVSQIGNSPIVPTGGPSNVDYLVIAGGGGGGQNRGGGGGAGGHRTTFPSPGCNAGSFPITATAFPITVAGGGSGGPFPSGCKGGDGSNSVFSTITSAGGGGGGSGPATPVAPGNSGGSGGGGGSFQGPGAFTGVGGSGNTPSVSPPQGNNGGNGRFNGIPSETGRVSAGGGGGGSSGAGTPYSEPADQSIGGPGGAGTANSITGSSVTRAGGGGGQGDDSGGSGGSGGAGGGAFTGGDATANTGSGGGGGKQPGGTGGSGIVIIRYKYQ